MGISGIQFDKPFFDDLPPEEKSSEELVWLLLNDVAGVKVNLSKYSSREIQSCARKLIENGFLRGTIHNFYKCSWSRLTIKGRMLLKLYDISP